MALPNAGEDKQERTGRPLSTPTVDGQEVPEGGLVEGVSGRSAAILRIRRDCVDRHSVVVLSKMLALDELAQLD
jgi:hypothetical protein